MPLYIAGYDAAGETTSAHQDGRRRQQHPDVSLSGPTDAPSTAGTQYVTASAAGSPSGIDGIACSVDGGPGALVRGRERAGAGERLGRAPGQLQRVQQRRRRERNPRRVPDRRRWSLKIGAPTVMGVGFAKYVGLKCHVVKRRKTIRGHWVTALATARRSRSRPRRGTRSSRSPSATRRPSASASSPGCRSDATGRSCAATARSCTARRSSTSASRSRRTGNPTPPSTSATGTRPPSAGGSASAMARRLRDNRFRS